MRYSTECKMGKTCQNVRMGDSSERKMGKTCEHVRMEDSTEGKMGKTCENDQMRDTTERKMAKMWVNVKLRIWEKSKWVKLTKISECRTQVKGKRVKLASVLMLDSIFFFEWYFHFLVINSWNSYSYIWVQIWFECLCHYCDCIALNARKKSFWVHIHLFEGRVK